MSGKTFQEKEDKKETFVDSNITTESMIQRLVRLAGLGTLLEEKKEENLQVSVCSHCQQKLKNKQSDLDPLAVLRQEIQLSEEGKVQ